MLLVAESFHTHPRLIHGGGGGGDWQVLGNRSMRTQDLYIAEELRVPHGVFGKLSCRFHAEPRVRGAARTECKGHDEQQSVDGGRAYADTVG